MKTTGGLVEILVTGAMATLALAFFMTGVGDINIYEVLAGNPFLREWKEATIPAAIAVAYVLGAITNTMGYILLDWAAGGRKIKTAPAPSHPNDPAIPRYPTRYMKSYVLQHGSEVLNADLGSSMPYIRMYRSAVLYFILFGVGGVAHRYYLFAGISFVLTVFSFIGWRRIYTLYWRDMKTAFDVLTQSHESKAVGG
jgi:hypothetical protein